MQSPSVTEYTQQQIIEKTKQASNVAFKLLHEISKIIKPGITETQARIKAQEIYEKHGIKKSWHKPYIYFGTNTILTFMDKPKEEKTLQEKDIAYIDIGPIIDGVEGDAGHTLVFGNNSLFNELKLQSSRIFNLGVDFWRKNNPTGIELYKCIYKLTEEAGFIFNLNPAGHLIGSFPHKGWKEGLHTYPYPPEPGYWILEIQIRHPEKPYGAFYEAVLL
ncbi:MAG: M24 family metallopeptidase [Candidatus Melainabacteria bacterium]|nr:M24 family metallopeptidase [Candidatus Melainabacteria bacterium]